MRPVLVAAAVVLVAAATPETPAVETHPPSSSLRASTPTPLVTAWADREVRPHASRSIVRSAASAAGRRARPVKPRPKVSSRQVGLQAWLNSSKARAVLACESHTNYSDMSRHAGVIYYGAWQANASFWRSYGGDPRYLTDRSLFTAPKAMQDAVAYRGWLARGWQPWACA